MPSLNLQLHPAMGPAALRGRRSVANCDDFLSFGRSNHHKIMMVTGSKAAGVIGKSFGCHRLLNLLVVPVSTAHAVVSVLCP